MNHKITLRITSLILELRQLQNADGSFSSVSISPEQKMTKSHTTTYYTSLILLCLRNTPSDPNKDLIVSAGLLFLRHARSASGTWNYFADRSRSSYPDDLDDTFLALSAISSYDPEFLTPSEMADIAHILIASEVTPGGPYYTWIVDESARKDWIDIDIVTNSTISVFLSSLGVSLDGMSRYFEEKIRAKDFFSRYYPFPAVGYFLSRLAPFDVPGLTEPISLLDTAVTVSMRLLLEYPSEKIESLVNHLLDPEIPAAATGFFIEKIISGQAWLSGSLAFTLAATIEALAMYSKSVTAEDAKPQTKPHESEHQQILEMLHRETDGHPELQKNILLRWSLLEESDPREELRMLTLLFYENLNPDLMDSSLKDSVLLLCLAGSLGWIGYTLQDDIVDGQESPNEMPIATSCILTCQEIFADALLGTSDANAITRILHGMNEALANEHAQRTITTIDEKLSIPENIAALESITSISQKSLGYAAGPMALMLLLDIPDAHRQMRLVEKFFDAYLAARQLHDDMHDWYDDLTQGYISPVGAMVLGRYAKKKETVVSIASESSRYDMNALFWNEVVDDAIVITREFLDKARTCLERMDFLEHKDFLAAVIQRYETSLSSTQDERDSVMKFISAYEKTTP